MPLPEPFFFEGGMPAVVLLHTFAGTTTDVRVLGRQFQKAGYTVLGPQFTGHGTGDPTDIFTLGSPEAWWQDTNQAIDQLVQAGHEQVAVFGESLGGLFAMKALELRDEVVAGGTISTPLFPVNTDRVANRFLADAAAWYEKSGLPKQTSEPKLTTLHQAISPMLAEIAAYTVPIHDQLATIKKPVFVGQPEADELIDPTVGQRLADTLSAQTEVSFHLYTDAPHVMTYSPAGRMLAEDLIAFTDHVFQLL